MFVMIVKAVIYRSTANQPAVAPRLVESQLQLPTIKALVFAKVVLALFPAGNRRESDAAILSRFFPHPQTW
jgi:hypothetical protein